MFRLDNSLWRQQQVIIHTFWCQLARFVFPRYLANYSKIVWPITTTQVHTTRNFNPHGNEKCVSLLFFYQTLFFNLLLKGLSHLYRWILYATSASTPVGLHERYYIANHLSGCLMLAVSGYWPKVITGSLHRLYLLPSFRKFPKKLWCQKKISVFLFLLPRIIMKEVMRNLIKKTDSKELKIKTSDCRSLDF